MSDDFKNMMDKEKYESFCKVESKRIGLNKDLQIKLRKKQYQFPRSNEYLKRIDFHVKGTMQNRSSETENRIGCASDEDLVKLGMREKKKVSAITGSAVGSI